MHIISRKTLREFWGIHSDAEGALKTWFKIVCLADWRGPDDVKRDYRSASFLRENRVCFNICGNKYRLVVRINYPYRVIYIRFIGTHKAYDKVNISEV